MASRRPEFAGAVLAGGASTRMGRDKALIPVGDGRLVDLAVRALRDAGASEVVIVGGNAASLATAADRWLPDRWPGEGPLGGVITALGALRADYVVVLACDLTGPQPHGVHAVLDAVVADPSAAVAVPRVEGRRQWLHGAWPRRVLPELEAAFAAGARGPRAAVADRAVVLDGLPAAWFLDADTPDELPA